MNTFFYNRKPNSAFTTMQIKHIYQCLKNLGLKETYDQFLTNLSDYCEQQMAEEDDFYLTDKEAAPFISGYTLSLLEQLTQSNLLSKIFALSSPQRQAGVDLQIPVIFVDEADVLEYVKSCAPDLEPLLNIPEQEHGLLIGYSRPQVPETNLPEVVSRQEGLFPRPESVSRIKLGTAAIAQRTPNGTMGKTSTEIVKISLFIGEYEIPLFRNTELANTITVENIPCEGSILVQDKGFFTIPEYLYATKEIATEPRKVVKSHTAIPHTAATERR